MDATVALHWDNRTARLPDGFHQRVEPTPVPDPYPVAWNETLARELGWPGDLGDPTTDYNWGPLVGRSFRVGLRFHLDGRR